MDNEYSQFAEMLWRVRRLDRRGISVRRVAQVAECDPKTWRAYEKGNGAPDGVQIDKVERAFGWNLRLSAVGENVGNQIA